MKTLVNVNLHLKCFHCLKSLGKTSNSSYKYLAPKTKNFVEYAESLTGLTFLFSQWKT